MLRLTTNVTVSPASSARSSSAASRMPSIASGRVSANIAVSSSALSARPSRARSVAPATRSGRIGGAPLAAGSVRPEPAPRDEAPVLDLDRVHHAPRDPLGVDVARVDAQALGQRVAVPLQRLAHLVGRGEGVLRGDVVAVRRQPAEVGRARGHQLRPPVREVRGAPGCPRPASAAASRRSAASCPRCSPDTPTRAAAAGGAGGRGRGRPHV